MSSSIFDWDDEEEKKEDRHANFQQPVEAVDYWEQNEPQNSTWNDPWKETATEERWEEEPVEYIQYQPEYQENYQPASADEDIRRGGLAWSAGIVFFSSIVFMLFIGWGADRLLGSSPWGIVGGIVIGSILGFIQFFRISSQIFDSSSTHSSSRTLMPEDDEER